MALIKTKQKTVILPNKPQTKQPTTNKPRMEKSPSTKKTKNSSTTKPSHSSITFPVRLSNGPRVTWIDRTGKPRRSLTGKRSGLQETLAAVEIEVTTVVGVANAVLVTEVEVVMAVEPATTEEDTVEVRSLFNMGALPNVRNFLLHVFVERTVFSGIWIVVLFQMVESSVKNWNVWKLFSLVYFVK